MEYRHNSKSCTGISLSLTNPPIPWLRGSGSSSTNSIRISLSLLKCVLYKVPCMSLLATTRFRFRWSRTWASGALNGMKKLIPWQIIWFLNSCKDDHNLPAPHNLPAQWGRSCRLLRESWKTIFRSILLMTFNKYACNHFGEELIIIQAMVDEINKYSQTNWPQTNWHDYRMDKNGKIGPVPSEHVPDSLHDPCHCGHLMYKFCELVESMDRANVVG